MLSKLPHVEMVGRDRELAQLRLALGSGNDGTRFAYLSGESGSGKTLIATRLTREMIDSGFTCVTVHGRAGSRSTPLAPLREAFPEIAGKLDAAAVERSGLALAHEVQAIATCGPLLVVIDDVHALDETSLALLPFLWGVPEMTNLSVLLIAPSDQFHDSSTARATISQLSDTEVVHQFELARLAETSLRTIAANVLGVEETDVPNVILERAGGNPFHVRELASYASADLGEVPTSITSWATARLHTLSIDAQELAVAASLMAEGVPVTVLSALQDNEDTSVSIELVGMERSGLVRIDGGVVSASSPIIREAITGTVSAARRRALHLAIAELAPTAVQNVALADRLAADHLAAAGKSHEAVAAYLRAAAWHEDAGYLHEYCRDLQAALNHESRVEQRIQIVRETASIATQLGLLCACDLWRELVRLAAAVNDDDLYAYGHYELFFASGYEDVGQLEKAATFEGAAGGWASQARGLIEFSHGELDRSLPHLQRAVDLATASDDPRLHSYALAMLANARSVLGETSRSVMDLRTSIDALVRLGERHRAVLMWQALVETILAGGHTSIAHQEAERLHQYVDDLSLERYRAISLATQALAAWELGRAEDALSLSICAHDALSAVKDTPLEVVDHTAYVQLIRAKLANEIGLATAQEIAANASAPATSSDHPGWIVEADYETFRARARVSGLEAALGEFPEFDEHVEPALVANASGWLLRTSLLSACAAGSDKVRDLRVASEIWDVGGRVSMLRDEIDAVLAAVDSGDVSGLETLANDREANSDFKLDPAYIRGMAGAIALKAGQHERATVLLQLAKKTMTECGATADAGLVSALLRQAGVRSRAASGTSAVGELTARQLEIARLASTGLTTGKIAAALHISDQTVATHMSNIYRKIEVSSRTQLAQWMRSNDSEFESTFANAG